MTVPPETRRRLDAVLDRLEREQVLVLELDRLEHLLSPPDDPMAPSTRSGIDHAAATLCAARKLPEQLTVRVALRAEEAASADVADMTVAFHRRATETATSTWQSAMAVRSMGRRQWPLGIVIATVCWFMSYATAALAATLDSAWAIGAAVVVAGLALTVSWVVSWMVVEVSIFDWRERGRSAAAYELLSSATLEVTDGSV